MEDPKGLCASGRSRWPQVSRRFSTPWVVVASARAFSGVLKPGGAPEILGFSRRKDPFF